MLTVDRVKKMPITMAILKDIKDTYGIPEKVTADTLYGIECYSIWIYGLNVSKSELLTIANKHRTEAMRNGDDELDICDLVPCSDKSFMSLLDDITCLFKEL